MTDPIASFEEAPAACHSAVPIDLPVMRIIIFIFGFGRFPAELGPETRSTGSGSKNGAERTQNQPRRPILRPFRDHFLVRPTIKI